MIMAKAKFPQYLLTQFLDTSEDAMEQTVGTILYGIETRRAEGGQWKHCATSAGLMLFKTRDEASEAVTRLKAADAAKESRNG